MSRSSPTEARRFSLAGARRLDTSEARELYVLPLPGGAHVRLSAAAYALLRAVDEGASFDEIAAHAQRGGAVASAAGVAAAYDDVVARIARSAAAAADRPASMWLKLRLIPASIVRRLAAIGQLAFHPPAAAALLALILAGAIAAAATWRPVDASAFFTSYALFLCALVAHELGHASACARFGAAPSEIGFVLYLVYPAFYSNVSAAWTLPRRQRVLVDLGGIYFELVFGAGCALAFAWTRWPPLGLTMTFIASSCAVSLNPIFRFDGYWVLADALGVTNLGRQPRVLFEHLVRRLRRLPPKPLPWPAPVVAALCVHTALTLAVFVWFAAALAPSLAGIVRGYPSLVAGAARALVGRAWPAPGVVRDLVSGAYILLFLGVVSRQIARASARAVIERLTRGR